MKTMSKFFLIVAGIITLIGGALLVVGSVSAKSAGIQLFPKKTDGKYIYTVDLTNTDVSKIAIDATDTDIYVYTHQDNEYIEFINFNENYYSISTTNRVISFDEYVDFSSIISFWDSNFSFKGMRSLFRLATKVDGKKEVNIYLSDDRDINIFDFSIERGTIKLSDISTKTDYKFTLDKGKIELSNISTLSGVTLKANECTMNCVNCSFSTFKGDVATLALTGEIGGINQYNLNAKSGSVECDLDFASDLRALNVITTSGVIVINNEAKTSPFKTIPDDTKITNEFSVLNITGETISINLNYENNSDNKTEEKQ